MSDKDRYELLSTLGQNDYLTVYRGWDWKISRPVAVLELDRKYVANETQYDQVWNQVLSFASLRHVGLVQVYEAKKDRGWFVTELMHGSVATKISRAGLSNKEVRSLLRTCLATIGYLHAHNKLHGDIRPANILIDSEGHIRLSYPVGLEIGGQVPRRVLNPKYLAPELVNHEFGEAGPATDLYCLGFAAYELLVGPNFDDLFLGVQDHTENGRELDWVRWHSSHRSKLPPLKSVVPDIDEDLASAIDQLIHKSVAERPHSAEATLQMLAVEPEVLFATEQLAVVPSTRRSHYAADDETDDVPGWGLNGSHKTAGEDSSNPLAGSERLTPTTTMETQTSPQPNSQTWMTKQLNSPWRFGSFVAVVAILAFLAGLSMFRPAPAGPIKPGQPPEGPPFVETSPKPGEQGTSVTTEKLLEEIRKLDAALIAQGEQSEKNLIDLKTSLDDAKSLADKSQIDLALLQKTVEELKTQPKTGSPPSADGVAGEPPSATLPSAPLLYDPTNMRLALALEMLRQMTLDVHHLNAELERQPPIVVYRPSLEFE
jgi:serine/threonine protein kinase